MRGREAKVGLTPCNQYMHVIMRGRQRGFGLEIFGHVLAAHEWLGAQVLYVELLHGRASCFCLHGTSASSTQLQRSARKVTAAGYLGDVHTMLTPYKYLLLLTLHLTHHGEKQRDTPREMEGGIELEFS
jgi:hypothetical protein